MKLRSVARVGATLALVMSVAPVAAQNVPPAEAFGAINSVQDADLSPDGSYVSFIAPRIGGGNTLFVAKTGEGDGAGPQKLLVADGNPEQLLWCSWIGKARLVCKLGAIDKVSGFVLSGTRVVAIDADGTNVKLLTRRDPSARYATNYAGEVIDLLPDEDGAVLMLRWHVPQETTGSLIRSDKEGYALDRIDSRTLQIKPVTDTSIEIGEYITDGRGTPRIMGVTRFTGQYTRTGVTRYKYRKKAGGAWLDLSDFDSTTDRGFNPYAVDADEDVAYGVMKVDGRFGVYKRKLDGSLEDTLVYARPDVDVNELVRIGRKRRVVGVAYTTDRKQTLFTDPGMAKLATSLSKALPGAPLVSFVGASDDEQKLLLFAGSDRDPGKYYLLDRGTRQLRPLLEVRPQLADYQLAEVRPVQVKAADGVLIPAYLTLPPGSTGKNLPALVMPHGGPSARDDWGFDWLAQYFAHRGYAVLQPNYRGSSGYGDAWYQQNGFIGWRAAIGDITDSGRWLVSQGIADPAKLAILGWSYGGYAALQSGVVAPDLFKAIVAIAPVTDLQELKQQYAGTSASQLARVEVGVGPHLREGSPYRNAAAITAPVMMFHGDLDRNVFISHSKMMSDALRGAGKRVQLFTYPNLEHSLVDSSVRAEMLSKSDAFLRETMGIR